MDVEGTLQRTEELSLSSIPESWKEWGEVLFYEITESAGAQTSHEGNSYKKLDLITGNIQGHAYVIFGALAMVQIQKLQHRDCPPLFWTS